MIWIIIYIVVAILVAIGVTVFQVVKVNADDSEATFIGFLAGGFWPLWLIGGVATEVVYLPSLLVIWVIKRYQSKSE